MRQDSIWQKPDTIDVSLLANGQPSKCLNNWCVVEGGMVDHEPVTGSYNTKPELFKMFLSRPVGVKISNYCMGQFQFPSCTAAPGMVSGSF